MNDATPLRIVDWVEKEFGGKVEDEDLLAENFYSTCERQKCIAWPIELSGVSYHSRLNGNTSEVRPTPRLSLRGPDFVDVHHGGEGDHLRSTSEAGMDCWWPR